MAATAFTDLVDEATARVATARKAAIRSALTTCQTALAGEFTTYGLNDKDSQAVNDKLIDLARYIDAAVR